MDDADVGGIGGTLAGNALSIAAMKATLQNVLTDEFYAKAIDVAGAIHGGSRRRSSRSSTCRGSSSGSATAPNTGSARRRPATAAKPPPQSTTNSTATCTSLRSTAAS
ncbi:MAG: hypothetical protein MZV70_21345 [Desulfobacterales bacterium]|nr:hypothetical protein [Desulfobacterales bacterium]